MLAYSAFVVIHMYADVENGICADTMYPGKNGSHKRLETKLDVCSDSTSEMMPLWVVVFITRNSCIWEDIYYICVCGFVCVHACVHACVCVCVCAPDV